MKTVPEPFGRTALLVVDMQNAFFEEPALAVQRERVLGRSNELVAAARARGIPIFNIKTSHRKDRSTWTLNMLEDDQGFLFEGTTQADALEGLDIRGTVEVAKHRDSSFWDTNLLELLRNDATKTLVLCGVSSHSCIAATATDAYAANLRVVVARDAIASTNAEFEKATLHILQEEYRQPILSTSEIVSQMPDRNRVKDTRSVKLLVPKVRS